MSASEVIRSERPPPPSRASGRAPVLLGVGVAGRKGLMMTRVARPALCAPELTRRSQTNRMLPL